MGRSLTTDTYGTSLTAGEAIASGDLVVQANGEAWAAGAPDTFLSMGRPTIVAGGNSLTGRSVQAFSAGSSRGPLNRVGPLLLASGNAAMMYDNGSGIWLEILTVRGLVASLTRVDSTAQYPGRNNQGDFSFAELTNGNIVVAWCSGSPYHVYFSIIDPTGQVIVAPTRFGSGVQVGSSSFMLGLAALTGGGFAITANLFTSSSYQRTCLGVYTNAGAVTLAITELESNTTNNTNTQHTKIVALAGGGFGVFGLLSNTTQYRAQTFNAAGAQQGSTWVSSSAHGGGTGNLPSICQTSSGGWAAFYLNSSSEYRAVAFSSAGATATAEWVTGVITSTTPYTFGAYLMANGYISVMIGGGAVNTQSYQYVFNSTASTLVTTYTTFGSCEAGNSIAGCASVGNNIMVMLGKVTATAQTYYVTRVSSSGAVGQLAFGLTTYTGTGTAGAGYSGIVGMPGYGTDHAAFALWMVDGSNRHVEAFVMNAPEASPVGIAMAAAAVDATVRVCTYGRAKYKRVLSKRASIAMPGAQQLVITGDSAVIGDYTPRSIN